MWGYYNSKSHTEKNMAPRKKTTRTSHPGQPTPMELTRADMLVESLAPDDEGFTPRNEEHSIPQHQYQPDPPLTITMADIERIALQLNVNMQRSQGG